MDFRILKIEEKYILQYWSWLHWKTVMYNFRAKESISSFPDIKVKVTKFFDSSEEAESFAEQFILSSSKKGNIIREFSVKP